MPGFLQRLRRGFGIVALVALAWVATFSLADAQERTVGLLLHEPGSSNGYTLFAPMNYERTYLIDNDGRLVHSWDSDYTPSSSVYLLENGNLLRTGSLGDHPFIEAPGATGGRVEEFTWEGDLVWEFEYRSDEYTLHHDIERLPNGNVLMIAFERVYEEEALAAGRDPALLEDGELWPDYIIEVEPTGSSGGNIVWEWHIWDHLVQDFDPTKDNFGVVEDHPELVDVNFTSDTSADWTHANGIDYNAELDQIVFSVRHFSEFWVIDHSTTTEEAAGHTGGNSGKGGDLLYRWGNPQAYGAGDAGDQMLFWQHDAQWIESGLPGEGNFLVFNNGNGRPGGEYTSVDEIEPPVDAGGNYQLTPGEAFDPAAPAWTYADPNPTDFYAAFISGAQRLPNGNTLIDHGVFGLFFEVTPEGETVWRYVNPVTADGPIAFNEPFDFLANIVFRATRYPKDYPGLEGQNLLPCGFIELDQPVVACGDVSGDGSVNSIDSLWILWHAADLVGELERPEYGDINGDGALDPVDSAIILQFVAGLIANLPP